MKNSKLRLLMATLVSLGMISLFAAAQPARGQESPAPTQEVTPDSVQPHPHDQAVEKDIAEAIAMQEEAPPPDPPGLFDFLFNGRYLAFLIMAGVALVLLLTRWINRWVRIGVLAVAFVLFGIDTFYPLHPSPMCAVTKLFMFKFTHGQFFPVFLAMFAAIIIPSFIGRKLFCGWVCPLGALQELVNKIPHRFHWKQFNFTAFNTLRMGLLAMFFFTFFGVRDLVLQLGEQVGADTTSGLWAAYSAFSLYDTINFFELLHWQVTTSFVVMMTLLIAASLFLYRPFCYLICPIGAITWLVEKVSLGRIRVDHAKCTECGTCDEESPCPTIKPMREGTSKALPDCTSCGECVKTCPEDAISFRFFK